MVVSDSRREERDRVWLTVFAAISLPHGALYGAFAGQFRSAGHLAYEALFLFAFLVLSSIFIVTCTFMLGAILNFKDRKIAGFGPPLVIASALQVLFSLQGVFLLGDQFYWLVFLSVTMLSWAICSFVGAAVVRRRSLQING